MLLREMPTMWQQQILYLSVALVCCELRYTVVVCDYVWAHPAAHQNMVSKSILREWQHA